MTSWQIRYYYKDEMRKTVKKLLRYEKLPFNILFDSLHGLIITNLSITIDRILPFLSQFGHIRSLKSIKYETDYGFMDPSINLDDKDYGDRKFAVNFDNNQNDYKKFYPSGIYSDVTIIVNKGIFPVHKIILSSISDFFVDLFNSGDVVEIHDIDVETFNNLLYFLYNHTLYQTAIKTLKMFELAHRLSIRNLDFENTILSVKIEESDFDEYIEILSLFYPDAAPDTVIYHLAKTLGERYIDLVPGRWNHQVQNLLPYIE